MIVWFILGPIGAGKTTFITSCIKQKKHFGAVYLSADVIMKKYNMSYLDARNKMETIINEHIAENKSFITEGTGQHNDLFDWFVSFADNKNIELKLTYIDVDLDVAMERNK